MSAREALLESLRQALGAGTVAPSLAGAALCLAALDRPGLALAHYRDHVAGLCDEVAAAAAGRGPGAAVEVLTEVLVRRHGYRGDEDTYSSPDNANLMSVIDRRRGIPVSLSVLWLEAARARGWQAAGINFPGHFLIRIENRLGRAMVDPYGGGRVLAIEDLRALLKSVAGLDAELQAAHYAAVDDRAILIRLLNNLRLRAQETQDPRRALAAAELITELRPEDAQFWLELAVHYLALDEIGQALRALDSCMRRCRQESLRSRALSLMAQLRRRLN